MLSFQPGFFSCKKPNVLPIFIQEEVTTKTDSFIYQSYNQGTSQVFGEFS